MTVQYYQHVLTSGPIVFVKLLLRWRGCVVKLIYLDFIIFGLLYTLISLIYRLALTDSQMRWFETIVLYVYNFQSMIPIGFILGFYVNLVYNRFWQHFDAIPWLIRYGMTLNTFLDNQSLQCKMIRKAMTRYMNAALVITSSRLHVTAKKRFPTMDSIIQAGILTNKEAKIIENTKLTQSQPFVPIIWSLQLLTMAERMNLVKNQFGYASIVEETNKFRGGLLKLFLTDQVCVPLVYTQVVTLAVYSYFVACLIGRQFIVEHSCLRPSDSPDMYVPIVTLLEFIIYMGWLKVAETLLNPMGEDDEDFDINEIIDFNWKVTMHMAESVDIQAPTMIKDKFWAKSIIHLPHTAESMKLKSDPYLGSTYDLNVPMGADLRSSRSSLAKESSVNSQSQHYLNNLGLVSADGPRNRSDSRPSTALLASYLKERAESLLRDNISDMEAERIDSQTNDNHEPSSMDVDGLQAQLSIPTSGLNLHHITEPIAEEDEEEIAKILKDDSSNSHNGSRPGSRASK